MTPKIISDIYLIDIDDALRAAGGSADQPDRSSADDSVIWQP
jgi:hypothetical protein